MKNKLYLISVFGLGLITVFVYVCSNLSYFGVDDMSNFTSTNGWCGNNPGSINPSLIPEHGCLTITNGFVVSRIYSNHKIEMFREESGDVIYKLDGVILSAQYGSDYKGVINIQVRL